MKPQEFMFLGQGKSVGKLGGMLRLGKHQGWMALDTGKVQKF